MPIVKRKYTCPREPANKCRMSKVAGGKRLGVFRNAARKTANGGKVVTPKRGTNLYKTVRAAYNNLVKTRKNSMTITVNKNACRNSEGKFTACARVKTNNKPMRRRSARLAAKQN
jgi:hypothetical protein